MVALDLLKSLADELYWCTGNCGATGSKLKFDILDEGCKEIEQYGFLEKCPKCKRTMVSEKNLWIIRSGLFLMLPVLPLIGFGCNPEYKPMPGGLMPVP